MMTFRELVATFVADECGAILSAEAALLGTVGVLGAGVGVSAMAESVDAEMKEVAFAIRSLDQSYSIPKMGCECGKAWTAGSSFTQTPVETAHRDLQETIDAIENDGAENDGATSNEEPAEAEKLEAPRKRRMEKRKRRKQDAALNQDGATNEDAI